jgi:hypothetical protein
MLSWLLCHDVKLNFKSSQEIWTSASSIMTATVVKQHSE